MAQTRWGPVQVRLTLAGGKITAVDVVQYPNGNGRDQEINADALPVLVQETISRAEREHRHGQRRDRDLGRLRPVAAERARPGGAVAVTAPAVRRVEHVMGMPISLALRGRHAGDARGDAAWAAALAVLREADRVFSTYRAESVISRLGRGEIGLADCPPEVAEVLAIGAAAEQATGGAFAVRRGGVLDPSGGREGLGRRTRRRPARGPARHRLLPVRGRRHHLPHRRSGAPRRGASASRTRGTRAGSSRSYRCARGAVATSGTAHRGAHIVDARTGRAPTGLASVTVIGTSLTAVDVDATAAFALGADGERWLAHRGHRAALVVRADGSTLTV